MADTKSLRTCPLDILSPILSLLDPQDIFNLKCTGDARILGRLASEPLLTELCIKFDPSQTLRISRLLDLYGTHLCKIKLTELPVDGTYPNNIIHSWHSSLPPSLVQIDFAFIGSIMMWVRPREAHDNIHWTLASPQHAYVPVNMSERFPNLKSLRLFDPSSTSTLVSVLVTSSNTSSTFFNLYGSGVLRLGKPSPSSVMIRIHWTEYMFGLWVKLLPRNLDALHLSTLFDPSIFTPHLPTGLSELSIVHPYYPVNLNGPYHGASRSQTQPVSMTISGHILPPLYGSLTSFRYILPSSQLELDLPRFTQLHTLDLISTRILGSQLHLLPESLKELSINCLDFGNAARPGLLLSEPIIETIPLADLQKLPRSLVHLRLHCIAPMADLELRVDFVPLLPPMLVSLVITTVLETSNRSLTSFHLASLRHLSHLRHLGLSNVTHVYTTLDWITPSLTSLKLSGGGMMSNNLFLTLPPCNRLVRIKAPGNITFDVSPVLPRGLTRFVITTEHGWTNEDWQKFRAKCPPSLTYIHFNSPTKDRKTLRKYRIDVQIPSNIMSIMPSTLQNLSTLPSPSHFNWSQYHPDKAMRDYLWPQSITCIDISSEIVSFDSPLLKLMNLVKLKIGTFDRSYKPSSFEFERRHNKNPLGSQIASQDFNLLSEALNKLSGLKELLLYSTVDMHTAFWLRLPPLQQCLTDLTFFWHQVPEHIDSLAKFTNLQRLNIQTSKLDPTTSETSRIWNSIPRCISQLVVNSFPIFKRGDISSNVSNFPSLTALSVHRVAITRALAVLAPKLRTLVTSNIAVDSMTILYSGLNRELTEVGDLELVQSICPSVTSLSNGTKDDDRISISWEFHPPTELSKQLEMVQSLPPNLTRLHWPHDWYCSLLQRFPKNLTALELTTPAPVYFDWSTIRRLPKTLKELSIEFLLESFPPKFTSWLPRGLETLISRSSTTLIPGDIHGLPSGIKVLILPKVSLSSSLLNSKASLTCLVLFHISNEAIKSLPISMAQLHLTSERIDAGQLEIPPTIAYLPFSKPNQLQTLVLAMTKLAYA